MNISLLTPLSRGWDRMKLALFKPFNIEVWFKLGFTAFLAGLLDGGGKGGGNSGGEDFDFAALVDAPYNAWEWLLNHPGWFFLIGLGISALFIVLVVFNWISSRGKFMFLDNVVQSRALVSQPWKEFRNLANSLFLWRFVFGLVTAIVIIGFLAYTWDSFGRQYYAMDRIPWFFIIQMALLFIAVTFVFWYVQMLLDSFVIPLMYKNKSSVTTAWSTFLHLHWQHFGHFLLFGVFALMLFIAIIVIVILFGLFTCCIGFLLLIIPYINSVVLLPITYTLRSFSLEYLSQFGDEWNVFVENTDK
jgi:hypothetical protein